MMEDWAALIVLLCPVSRVLPSGLLAVAGWLPPQRAMGLGHGVALLLFLVVTLGTAPVRALNEYGCVGGFMGEDCDTCAPGWLGEECDRRPGDPTPAPHGPNPGSINAPRSLPAPASGQAEGPVVDVGEDNFEALVSQHQHVLMLFYAPWCTSSAAMQPMFMAAATTLRSQGARVLMSRVDATAHITLAARCGLRTFLKDGQEGPYPTLRWFNSGQMIDYPGPRIHSIDMVRWVKQHTSSDLRQLKTQAEFDELLRANEAVVVGVFGKPECIRDGGYVEQCGSTAAIKRQSVVDQPSPSNDAALAQTRRDFVAAEAERLGIDPSRIVIDSVETLDGPAPPPAARSSSSSSSAGGGCAEGWAGPPRCRRCALGYKQFYPTLNREARAAFKAAARHSASVPYVTLSFSSSSTSRTVDGENEAPPQLVLFTRFEGLGTEPSRRSTYSGRFDIASGRALWSRAAVEAWVREEAMPPSREFLPCGLLLLLLLLSSLSVRRP
jgi:hypothetical protein